MNDKNKSFLEDIEKNMKNKEDLEYVKKRFNELHQECRDKEFKMEEFEKRIKTLEEEMKKVRQEIYLEEDMNENEIYEDVDYQFEVGCPFCNTGFLADINETTKSITCPNCEKEIELDWSEDLEDFAGCSGGCCSCSGCAQYDDDM